MSWIEVVAEQVDTPTTAALVEGVVAKIEDSMPDAPGVEKKRAALRELALALDAAIDFRKVVPDPLVGGLIETFDGPLLRLILGPAVEAAVRGLKKKGRKSKAGA